MKKSILISLLFIYSSLNNTFSQNLNYFPTGSKWLINNTDAQYYPFVTNYDYVYSLNGDTIVGNITYNVVNLQCYVHEGWMGQTQPDPNMVFNSWNSNHVFGKSSRYIRQSGKKLYVGYIENNQFLDSLLFDYDLTIGDTLPLTWNHNDTITTIIGIDSINVEGDYRKVFTLDNNNKKLIEGIGSEAGLFEYFGLNLNDSPELICYSIVNSPYYPTINSICSYNVGLSELTNSQSVEVYPNPFTNRVTIENKNSEIAIDKIYIIDQLGNEINLNLPVKSLDQNTIDLTTYSNGVYNLKVICENNIYSFTKIIKL
jgi:hypothetical protein